MATTESRMDVIKYKDVYLEYFEHQYNRTRSNERCVELSLAQLFLKMNKDLVEIGAVTPYYFEDYEHEVYDLTDDHVRAINDDGNNVDIKGKNVLCISTIEHFGEDTKKYEESIEFLNKVMKESKRYLITFPLGFNKVLDKYVEHNVKASYITRNKIFRDEWEVKDYKLLDDEDKKYNTYACANTICVIENFL